MPQSIQINGKKLNFAFSRVDGSDDSYKLIACTMDAKWNNKCEIYPFKVIKELKWLLTEELPYVFDMAEGMCAHQIVLSGEYIAFSCSKMFEDGSSRKVRVLSLSARSGGRPQLIAEQSTPVDPHVMVSPKDQLVLMRQSAQESELVYSVGSTIVAIKLLADKSNVSWRTWINFMNTCGATTEPLDLRSSGSSLLV